MLHENFSSRIAQLRKEADLKQDELAKAINVSQDTISMMERGKRLASMEVLVAIADYFNVSIDWLTGRSDIREKLPYASDPPQIKNDAQ